MLSVAKVRGESLPHCLQTPDHKYLIVSPSKNKGTKVLNLPIPSSSLEEGKYWCQKDRWSKSIPISRYRETLGSHQSLIESGIDEIEEDYSLCNVCACVCPAWIMC